MLRIIQPGLLTTVEDLGRFGHQAQGVPVGGPMDPVALRAANILVGNRQDAAALEIAIVGPTIVFAEGALVAIAGANLNASIGGVEIPTWRAVRVPAGGSLSFRGSATGCHAYLAVAGGVDVPPVMGSRSTYMRAAFGGHEGRALRAGDALAVGQPSPLAQRLMVSLGDHGVQVADWGVGPSMHTVRAHTAIRLIPGAHTDLLTGDAVDTLFHQAFQVSTQSDRMGYRLTGPALALRASTELMSEAVTTGTVQLPPGGAPIVLMADRATTGGYPRIGEVASVDMPLLAQRRPGDEVRFAPISIGDAQRLLAVREADFGILERAVRMRAMA